jgi:hypothetical protein
MADVFSKPTMPILAKAEPPELGSAGRLNAVDTRRPRVGPPQQTDRILPRGRIYDGRPGRRHP